MTSASTSTPPYIRKDLRRIAVLIPTFHGGGAERAMLQFAAGAVERGLSVDLLVCHSEGPLRGLVDPRVSIHVLGKGRVRGAFWALVRYLREKRPRAVFSTILHTNMLAITAVRLAGTRTRVIVRQSTSHLSERRKGLVHSTLTALIPWVYLYAHGVIAVSGGVRDQLRQVNRNIQIHVLPNPVLTDDFDERKNERIDHPWFQPGEPPVIVGAGRLQPFKGFASLVEAFSRLPEETGCRLVILGEGPERAGLTELAERLGIADRFHLPGFVLNPLPYMNLARVFALPSEYEGMPNVLLQAMACGTAVVATDCKSGPSEILEGGRLGHLVPVGDVSALANALQRALNEGPHPEAAERVRRTYSVQHAVDEYLSVAGMDPSPPTLWEAA